MARRQRRDLSVFESSCHLPTCLPHTAEASHCPFNCWTSSRKAMNTNFYSLWLDPTGNRTRVYRFSSRRSIHSTTDRLKPKNIFEKKIIKGKCWLNKLLNLNWGGLGPLVVHVPYNWLFSYDKNKNLWRKIVEWIIIYCKILQDTIYLTYPTWSTKMQDF